MKKNEQRKVQHYTAQKWSFPLRISSKIVISSVNMHSKCAVWLHLLKKSLMENFIFCVVLVMLPIAVSVHTKL